MANRIFYPSPGSLTIGVVKLFGTVTMGVGGAIASVAARGFTVTAPNANTLLITLEDLYQALFGVNLTVQSGAPPYTTAKALLSYVSADAVATTGAITLELGRQDNAGAWVDAELPDGAVVGVEITLDNSSV